MLFCFALLRRGLLLLNSLRATRNPKSRLRCEKKKKNLFYAFFCFRWIFFYFFNAFHKAFCSLTLHMHSQPRCTRIKKCVHFARVEGRGQNFKVQ
uniref:Uncharacterized protein n=1 Tax=Ixodes ricinus TaxID=34613 RepID=A0A6B0UEA5_IXORI